MFSGVLDRFKSNNINKSRMQKVSRLEEYNLKDQKAIKPHQLEYSFLDLFPYLG